VKWFAMPKAAHAQRQSNKQEAEDTVTNDRELHRERQRLYEGGNTTSKKLKKTAAKSKVAKPRCTDHEQGEQLMQTVGNTEMKHM
jgi:hypothetical protein